MKRGKKRNNQIILLTIKPIMMKITATILATLVLVLTLSMCSHPQQSQKPIPKGNGSTEISSLDKMESNKDAHMMPISKEDSAKYISKHVKIKGDIEIPLTLTVDSLKEMNVVTLENSNVVCQSGTTMKKNESCRGVLLKDILEKARIKQNNHKDRNFYIVARATDNYKATFSWAEIFNNPTGENVYVIFEENGLPISNQGEMILICKNDIKTGPRHVYWLESIEIHRVI